MTDVEAHLERTSILEEVAKRFDGGLIRRLFPEEDVLDAGGEVKFHARGGYEKHLEFFEAGKTHRERLLMAGNRVGKTLGGGGFETALHLTGIYPEWWPGRKWRRPTRWWAAGKTGETTRDIVQATLLGVVQGQSPHRGFSGSGLIPRELIGSVVWKASNVQGLADIVQIKHLSGGWSSLGLKSYNQGRGSFEGTTQDGIWFDEEPPKDVYDEAVIRTATSDGMAITTFTPLEGLSEVVRSFLGEDMKLLGVKS